MTTFWLDPTTYKTWCNFPALEPFCSCDVSKNTITPHTRNLIEVFQYLCLLFVRVENSHRDGNSSFPVSLQLRQCVLIVITKSTSVFDNKWPLRIGSNLYMSLRLWFSSYIVQLKLLEGRVILAILYILKPRHLLSDFEKKNFGIPFLITPSGFLIRGTLIKFVCLFISKVFSIRTWVTPYSCPSRFSSFLHYPY